MGWQKLSAAVVYLIAFSVVVRTIKAQEKLKAADPLSHAHAHNDYVHPRPLHDALDQGFCSIEADVWLVGGDLFVAHNLVDIRVGRTLDSLYLRPLEVRCRERDGWVYDQGRTVTLLVDFKSPGEKTYPVLKEQITRYRSLVTKGNGQSSPPLEVIITGNRPIQMIRADEQRLVTIDGRLSDLNSPSSRALMPLISDSWSSHFKWRGSGPMPDSERALLRSHATDAHAHRQRLRYWATPDSEAVWSELRGAGVDLIGTDDLSKLRKFLAE